MCLYNVLSLVEKSAVEHFVKIIGGEKKASAKALCMDFVSMASIPGQHIASLIADRLSLPLCFLYLLFLISVRSTVSYSLG